MLPPKLLPILVLTSPSVDREASLSRATTKMPNSELRSHMLTAVSLQELLSTELELEATS